MSLETSLNNLNFLVIAQYSPHTLGGLEVCALEDMIDSHCYWCSILYSSGFSQQGNLCWSLGWGSLRTDLDLYSLLVWCLQTLEFSLLLFDGDSGTDSCARDVVGLGQFFSLMACLPMGLHGVECWWYLG